MTPKQILVKRAFTRIVPSDHLAQGGSEYAVGSGPDITDSDADPLRYMKYPQSEFLRELDPHAHKINSLLYYPNPFTKDETGRVYQKVKARTALAFQRCILDQRVIMLTGNNTVHSILNHDAGEWEQEMLEYFKEGWTALNIESAVKDAIEADFSVGDAAISFWMDGGHGGWTLLSYTKGDTLYPHYDPRTGKLALLGRRYSMRDGDDDEIAEYLDVWDRTHYMRYRMDRKGLKGTVAKVKNVMGMEGWVVDQGPVAHGFPRIPVAYDRYGGPCWADSQDSIDKLEMSLSQLMENNNAYALRILYAFGADMKVETRMDGTPNQIHSSDPDAKVGFLEPSNSSGSFDTQMKWLKDNIYRASSVIERQEIKAGTDIATVTAQLMYADAYYKAQLDAMHFQPFLDDIVECVKHIWGVETGRVSDFAKFRAKAELEPFVFLSDTERVNNIQQLHAAGALSRRTAAKIGHEMGYGSINEYDKVRQEEHDDLVAEMSAQTQTAKSNPVSESRNQ